jgi:hypothetical protein
MASPPHRPGDGTAMHADPDAGDRLLMAAQRRLLRATTHEAAVRVLLDFVRDVGGWTVAPQEEDDRVLPVDLSLGVLDEPLLPAAEPYSPARLALETHLPTLIEDVHAVLARLDRGRP